MTCPVTLGHPRPSLWRQAWSSQEREASSLCMKVESLLYGLHAGLEELHAQARREEALRILGLAVGVEARLLLVGEDGAGVAVGERLDLAFGRLGKAEELAHVRLRPQLADPVVLDLLEVPLPSLVVDRQIREGDHLGVEPQTGLHGLKHRRVRDVDEAELARQVPDKVLALRARQLHLAKVVHRLETVLGLHKVCRSKGRRSVRQEEAIVHPFAHALDEARNLLDGRLGQEACNGQLFGGVQDVINIDARDLDGGRTVAAGGLAPGHHATAVLRDALVLHVGVPLGDRLRDA
mmetsp:Transcript_73952/g.212044  ORF Transcript_73952/g.212044 Transcript_73952/m.212044 type:complete len:293 (+) Transcript_73952:318-1196(+)